MEIKGTAASYLWSAFASGSGGTVARLMMSPPAIPVTNGVRHGTNGTRTLDVLRTWHDSAGMDSPRRISLLSIFAVSTAFCIFSGLQAYNYVNLLNDRKQSFHILLALNVTYWYAWAVLVPGVLWMARRYRFGRHTWKRAAAAHVVAVIVFTLAHAALTT